MRYGGFLVFGMEIVGYRCAGRVESSVWLDGGSSGEEGCWLVDPDRVLVGGRDRTSTCIGWLGAGYSLRSDSRLREYEKNGRES